MLIIKNSLTNKDILANRHLQSHLSVVRYPFIPHLYPQFCQKIMFFKVSYPLKDVFVQTVLVSTPDSVSSIQNKKLQFPEAFCFVRVQGIEPWSRPWQGRILPLNHTRNY